MPIFGYSRVLWEHLMAALSIKPARVECPARSVALFKLINQILYFRIVLYLLIEGDGGMEEGTIAPGIPLHFLQAGLGPLLISL